MASSVLQFLPGTCFESTPCYSSLCCASAVLRALQACSPWTLLTSTVGNDSSMKQQHSSSSMDRCIQFAVHAYRHVHVEHC
jgi:hypothetical protein